MSEPTTSRQAGRHDHAARLRATRSGKQRGCRIYIPAEVLDRTGFGHPEPPPFYRVWGNVRGRVTIQLYRER